MAGQFIGWHAEDGAGGGAEAHSAGGYGSGGIEAKRRNELAGDEARGLAFWAGGVVDDQFNAAIGKDRFGFGFRDALQGARGAGGGC